MKKIRRILLLPTLLLSTLAVFAGLPVHALTVLQLNLEQLTVLSEKVFVGRCAGVEADGDFKGHKVQKVTFEVIDMLKGEPSKTVTFRQLGTVNGGADFGMKEGVRIQGLERELPRYEVGEEAVVFLGAPGGAGLTAPVGLAQGKFAVISKGDFKTVLNGAGNRGLFIGAGKNSLLKTMSVQSGDLPYSDFVSLVKKLAAQ